MTEGTPSLRKRIQSFLDTAPKDAREIGWRWMIGDRVLRRLRVKEISLKPRGLDRPAFCRVGTSDIYEYQHLLGNFRDRIDLPRPVKVAVDAGANVGYSALRLRLEFPDALIIALEPEQSNISQFRKNCAGDEKIILEEKALWSKTARLRIRAMTAAANGFQVDEDVDGDIPALSMQDLISKYQLAQIDLLKIDIEGSEKIVFGSPEVELWLPQVQMILIETHDRVEPGCSEAVLRAVNELFELHGHRGEYSLYVRRRPAAPNS